MPPMATTTTDPHPAMQQDESAIAELSDGLASSLRLGWIAKRSLDVAVAGLALFLLLPLLVLLCLLIWASDGQAPIFRHTRIGQGGRSFGCLKFRSMVI